MAGLVDYGHIIMKLIFNHNQDGINEQVADQYSELICSQFLYLTILYWNLFKVSAINM